MGNVRDEPGSVGKHIFRLNNTRADLTANMGTCQIGIETDNLLFAYKDQNGDYHTCVSFVNGMAQISTNFALFEITEEGTARLGIKKLEGAVWVDTGNRLA